MAGPSAHPGAAAQGRKRVLFFAEAVTLAHVARIAALAAALDPARYEAVIACRQSHHALLPAGIRHLPLDSIPSEQFVRALGRGGRVYSLPTLRRYVQEDRALLAAEQPDLIVGDFRLSLSVSARLAQRPLAAICNAYWSPWAQHARMPLPELPMTRFLPLALAEAAFRAGLPASMHWHAMPLNQLLREFGMAPLAKGLRPVYTDADHVLYADVPEMHPTVDMPATHHFLGPILWEPPVALPPWWGAVPADRPWVYVTMGSSGRASVLDTVLQGLSDLPVTVLAATANDQALASLPANAHAAKYLPGTELARRSSVVICNGGSLSCQQALAAGVPVLGIASNMDQFMNMAALERTQAGMVLRADRLSEAALRAALQRLLTERQFRDGAAKVGRALGRYDARARFAQFVDACLPY